MVSTILQENGIQRVLHISTGGARGTRPVLLPVGRGLEPSASEQGDFGTLLHTQRRNVAG